MVPLDRNEDFVETKQSRKSRVEKSGSGAKPRAPSLPQIGSKPEHRYSEDKRSKSLIDNGKRIIPDIIKQTPSAHPRDREDPFDYELDENDDRLEKLLSPHPEDCSDSDRSEAYETMSRSESMIDLREISNPKIAKKDSKDKDKYDSKKSSLVSLGIDSLKHETMFDKIDEATNDDGPGAFKNPQAALNTAIEDLQSENWQVEVAALSALIRISVWNSELIISHMGYILDLVKHELKNPRSQVCKVAAQTFTKLFALFGMQIEKENRFEEIVKALLLKTGDTNKFLRVDASDALDTMVENVSIHKAVTSLITGGLYSRNVMIKICVSFLLLHIVKSLGANLFFNSSRETINSVLRSASELLEDGSQDVR